MTLDIRKNKKNQKNKRKTEKRRNSGAKKTKTRKIIFFKSLMIRFFFL